MLTSSLASPFLQNQQLKSMKRSLEVDEDEATSTGEENVHKKVKFPVVINDSYKSLPQELATRLKDNPDLYLSSSSSAKWNWADRADDLKELQLDFTKNEKDSLDNLIETNEKGPLPFPPLLLALHRDIFKSQQKLAQTHVESVKNGEFQDDSTEDLCKLLHGEELENETKFYITHQEIAHGIRRVDYTVPFVLNLRECFREFALSRGKHFNRKVKDESENPVTLRMLKENPEGHGLDKKVVDRFSDDHEIVDIQLNLRGKKKRLRAFKDSANNMLIPCKEKNCRHAELDYNTVSICSTIKQSPDKKLQQARAHDTCASVWDVNISNDDVVICESSSTNFSEPESLPKITNVQSLASKGPNRLGLTPLASQLPNPAKRTRAAPRSVMRAAQMQQAFPFPIASNATVRPGILSKHHAHSTPVTFGSNLAPNQIIVLPQKFGSARNVANPVPVQVLTASKLQQQQVQQYALQLGPTGINSSSPKIIPSISNHPEDSASSSGDPKIVNVFSTNTDSPKKLDSPKISPNISPKKVDSPTESQVPNGLAISPTGTVTPIEATEETGNDKPNGADGDSEETTAGYTEKTGNSNVVPSDENGTVLEPDDENLDTDNEQSGRPGGPTPFNIATNIFENGDDEDEDDEDTGAGSAEAAVDEVSQVFDVPQIVSTVGGVNMLPETILVTSGDEAEGEDPQPVNFESPIMAKAKESKLKQIRAKMSLDLWKQKLEFPIQKLKANTRFVVCPICERDFSADLLQQYRIHLSVEHKITIRALPDTKMSPNSNGRVGKVDNVPSHYAKDKEEPKVENRNNVVKEWYRCKACDELLQKKELSEHRAACCPNQRADFAFVPVKIAAGKKLDVALLCGLCEKSCDSAMGLRQHLTMAHKEIASKILLEPDMRCGSCLTKFDNSIYLTLHCQACTNRKASAETMLELAQGMLHCEICQVSHDSINETQDCYTNTQMIRCIICLNVVLSRGNFFHHMKTYHDRNTVGICCPFCELGEIPIRDCFIHIIDNHYNPILQMQKNRGLKFDTNNRIIIPAASNVTASAAAAARRQLANIRPKDQPDASKVPEIKRGITATASRLVLPNMAQAQGQPRFLAPIRPRFAGIGQTVNLGTTSSTAGTPLGFVMNGERPQYVALRTISPSQLSRTTLANVSTTLNRPRMLAIRNKQGNPVRIVGTTAQGNTIHQLPSGIQLVSTTNQILRQIRPITTMQGVAAAGLNNATILRGVRPIRPAVALGTATGVTPFQRVAVAPQSTVISSGLNILGGGGQLRPITPAQSIISSVGTTGSLNGTIVSTSVAATGIPRGGTIQAITPAQLQRRPILQGKQVVSGTLVNFSNPANLNLLQK